MARKHFDSNKICGFHHVAVDCTLELQRLPKWSNRSHSKNVPKLEPDLQNKVQSTPTWLQGKKQQQNQKGWFSGSHETLSACLFMSIILMSTRWFNTSRIQVQQPSLLTFCRIPQMPNGVAWCSQRTARQQPGRCIKRTSDRCTSPGWPVCFSYFFS